MYVLSPQQIRRNRRRLLLLLTLLLVPFVLAWLMVRFQVWLPAQTVNKGALLEQQTPISQWPLAGDPTFPEPLKQHWLLVLVTPDNCGEACSQWQHRLQQIHKALGKEGDRVRRVLLQPDDAGNPLPHPLPGMGQQEVRHWHSLMLTRTDWQSRPWLTAGYQVLIVDPRGNPVTGYCPRHTGADLLRDLKRLLRASATG